MLFKQPNIPDIEVLRRIEALSSLADNQLVALANQLRVEKAGKNAVLLKQKDTDPKDIFLISGSVELVAQDGKRRQITVNGNDSIHAIAQLRPSIYDVVTRSKAEYLKINAAKLEEFIEQSSADMGEISVHTLINDQEQEDTSLTRSFFQQLMSKQYNLPAMPSVASRLQGIYRGEQTDINKLVHILVSYPDVVRVLQAIARVDRKADSRMTELIQLSIRRLGVPSSYYLIMIYSVGMLIHRLPANSRQQILPWWEHCLDVAALSRMLAKKTSLVAPDLAMMAGLIHGIGAYALADFLNRQSHLKPSEEELQHIFATNRAQVTGLLLRKWDFGNNVIIAAEECGVWSRKPDTPPDLCDLVLVANYLATLKDNHIEQLPKLNEVPAFRKLQIDNNHGREMLQNIHSVKTNIKKLFSRLDSI